ncbi:MAG: M24 family metallopeptidase, partial [Patescibacteria group bacterium]
MSRLEALEDAAHASDIAMAAVVGYLRTASNPTAEAARALIQKMLDGLGYDIPEGLIVAGGLHTAEPHHRGEGTLGSGQPIVIDIFPRSRESGYFGDLSRTVCIGTPPLELVHMYDTVLEAQELAVSMLLPGVRGADVQEAIERHFDSAGFKTERTGPLQGEGFIHGVGHGVGQVIHEPPRIGVGSEDILKEGDVVTVEPGLYYKHIGGVRIEDMALITADGCRMLTHA